MQPLTLIAQTRQEIREACGDEPRWLCERFLEWTGSERAAEIAGWAVGPLRILLIVAVAVLLAGLARRAVHRSLLKVAREGVQRRLEAQAEIGPVPVDTREQRLVRAGQRIEAISLALQSVVALIVLVIALLLVLAELGISLAPLLAGAGVVGIALGFGAQTLVRDFLSGLFILIEDQYAVGDLVDLSHEVSGTVESISLRSTRVRAVDGVVWHIPNGEILRVGNKSQLWSRSLLDIEVAYDTDLAKAKSVIKEVADAYAADEAEVIDEPQVWGVEALGASGIAIRLVVKTQPAAQWRISRELRERIKAAFDEAGIEIPFPQQMVWHRSMPSGSSATSPPPPR